MKKVNVNVNKTKTDSQRKRLLAYMMRGGCVTNDSARKRPFYCQNLQGRIYDIRHKNNIDVKDRWVSSPSGAKYKEYYIECANE